MSKNNNCDCNVIHEEILKNITNQMFNDDKYVILSNFFKLFGDSTRLKILHALEQNEMCGCDLSNLLGITKSAVSHQLKALKLANLVKSRREGQTIYYSLSDDHIKQILDIGVEHIDE